MGRCKKNGGKSRQLINYNMKRFVFLLAIIIATISLTSCEKEENGFLLNGTTWYAEDANVDDDFTMTGMSVMLNFTEHEAIFNIMYMEIYPSSTAMMINIFYDYNFDAPTGKVTMRGKRGDVWIDNMSATFEDLGYTVDDAIAVLNEELMTLRVTMQFGTITLIPYEEETKSLNEELYEFENIGQININLKELLKKQT